MKLQSRLILQVQKTDDYSEPDQISELNGTSEAVTTPDSPEAATAPDVPTIEASEEDQNDSQQVIQSKNHSSTSLHILRIKSLATKKVLEEQDHISDQKSLPWDFCP